MRALLVSTYDLGRQPFGLASPAAWLRRAGVDVDCADTSREPLDDARILAASVIAFYLPMHTATRMAGPVIERVRRINPSARLCAYGLYAPLNREWLHQRGVTDILGPEAEQSLVEVAARGTNSPGFVSSQVSQNTNRIGCVPQGFVPQRFVPRLEFIVPDRAG